MTQNIETSKINAAVDLLIEGDVDLSNALGEDGLINMQIMEKLEKQIRQINPTAKACKTTHAVIDLDQILNIAL